MLWWRDRFRRGIHGPGGDLKNIHDGKADLRIVEKVIADEEDKGLKGVKKWVVNVPTPPPQSVEGEGAKPGSDMEELTRLPPVAGITIKGTHGIVGPFTKLKKGTEGKEAVFEVHEGMWEERRGVKVDGGERRKKHVRRQRKLEEIRKERK